MKRPPTAAPSSPRPSAKTKQGSTRRQDHLVIILDDEPAILRSVERLLVTHGYRVRAHQTAEDFFHAGKPSVPSCLLLDNHLGDGMNGLQVHAKLQRLAWEIPTVFVTAHWDVQAVVHVMREGADGFITKPYNPDDLLDAVAHAMRHARTGHQAAAQAKDLRAQAATLTNREREIVRLIVAGHINKEIADQLHIAIVTVKVHRGRAMRKLGAGNAAELASLATLAGITN